MIINSLQKNTLIDYPGKIACTIFVPGCNFRCGFCHNPELMSLGIGNISEEELFGFLKTRRDYLDGVCITGGEPLTILNIDFVKKIKDLGYSVKLDTNGSFPEKLKMFLDRNLIDYVAMDIKSSRSSYFKTTRRVIDLKAVKRSIRMISELPEYEFRTTVIPSIHNVEEIAKIRDWLLEVSGKPRLRAYYLQAFVPAMGKMNDESFEKIKSPSLKMLEAMNEKVKDSFEICEIRC